MVNWLNKEGLITKNVGSYVTIWKRIVNEDFPRGVMVGNRCLWNEDEVDEWIANQPKQVVMGDARERPAGHLNLKNVEPTSVVVGGEPAPAREPEMLQARVRDGPREGD